MSSFNANLQTYNVVTENELAEVLSHYSSEYVFRIIDDAMKVRFREVPVTTMPNVVGAWEQNFKAIITQYGSESREEVMRVRNETYQEIIAAICREFGLNFTIDDSIDIYSAAYHLYDFFVSNFTANMVSYYATLIYNERSNLYDMLGLAEMRKNKDSSTIYGKKIYKDIKLAIINANIDLVITAATEIPTSFYDVLRHICGKSSELVKYLCTIVSAEGDDFVSRMFGTVLNSDIRPDVITAIRFKLQEFAAAHEQTVDPSNINNAEINE